jgi:antitoxin component YwqK of YwqJK toxin-antitoxin module
MRKFLLLFGLLSLLVLNVRGQEIKEVNGICYSGDKPYSGKLVTHYENGTIKMESSFKKGMKHGEFRVYFNNGQLNEIRYYRKNVMSGHWITWNEKGIRVGEAGYKNGLKHGKWLVWSDEGNLLYEMYYSKGIKRGTWKNYNEQGEVIDTRTF